MDYSLHVFHGPSIHAPFAAVIAEFVDPFGHELPVSAVESQWRLVNKVPLVANTLPQTVISLAELISTVALRFQHPDDPEIARIRVNAGDDGGATRIALGFTDPSESKLVLQIAIEVALKLFLAARGESVDLKSIASKLQRMDAILNVSLPRSPIIRTLVGIARRRSIPVYPVAEKSRIWLYGQGSAGFHLFEAASERNSTTGMTLQQDKTLANRLVMRLGFPGVKHAIAANMESARGIARQLGYPVVVKPIASGKGKGVSAYVLDDAELGIAYANAQAISPRGVIVERHVAGNDHRLAVFGGKLAWVAARHPASVTGDGRSSIADLIDLENSRRNAEQAAAGEGLRQMVPDEDMILHLRKQGLSLESRPPTGTTVYLRSIANVSKGGSIVDVTSLAHPDNVEMAEAIARGFRMDALGIDLITPDIRLSWREVPCAVIEVNGMPGIYHDSRAEIILLGKFPAGSDGRIPSVLLIDAPAGMAKRVSAMLSAQNLAVGQVGSDYTLFNGHARCQPGEKLPARVMALISDPACGALVIETSAEWITKFGMPLDRFDLTLYHQLMQPVLLALVQSCSLNSTVTPAADTDLAPLIEAVLGRYAPRESPLLRVTPATG